MKVGLARTSGLDSIEATLRVNESDGTGDARNDAGVDGLAGVADDVGAEAPADEVHRVQGDALADQKVDEAAHVIAGSRHVDQNDVRIVETGRHGPPVHGDEVQRLAQQVL